MVSYNDFKKAQSLSTDIMVVVILILFGVIFLVVNQVKTVEEGPTYEEKLEVANSDSQIIVDNLKSNGVINSQNEVNVEKLVQLNEEQLREEFGIQGDFAIVFEKDGNLVKIDPESNFTCIGSEKIVVNNEQCR